MTNRISRRTLACALLASSALISTPAFAQIKGSGTIFKQVDDNGVDVTSGAYELELPMGSIGGNSPGALDMVEYLSGSSGYSLQAYFNRAESGTQVTITLTFGAFQETFTGAKTATSFTSDQGSGATLTKVSAEEYTYRAADGSTASFTWPVGMSYGGGTAAFCALGNEATCDLLPQNLTNAAGYGLTWDWHAGENCVDRTLKNGEIVQDCVDFYRIADIRGNGGWKVVLTYLNNTDPTTYNLPPSDWYKRTGATFWNGATQVGSATIAYPSSTVTQLTDIGGRTWQVTRDATTQYVTAVRRPGSASDNITMQRDANVPAKVTQVTKDGVTTNYGWVDGGSTRTLTVTNALSQQTVITSDMTKGRPTSIKDGLNRTTGFTYDSNVRLTRTTFPEGNYLNLTYDTRGNVTERRRVAKVGSGLADIVETASYDSTCTNPVKCNKPNSTTDAKGNVTDYTYDATQGGILTLTKPAPTTGAVRPQTRYSYSQIPAGGPYMLTGLSQCQTLASCTGAADEAKATIGYNSTTLLASSVTRANGTGTLSATSAVTYDNLGNLSTVDGPLSGTADTTKYRYDTANQLVGVTSPDPDGASALKMRAIRLTYRPDGQVSKQELGTVNSQSDPDWAAFSTLQTVDIGFDSNDRPITSKLSANGTDYALTQTSYDALGRTDCTAVRMNTAVYGSLPASACTLSTQGSFGPDRINQIVYDAAGEVTDNKVGVGTSDAATERHLTYTNNGLPATLKDGENNLTTFEYDGFDRLSKLRYPNATKGSGTTSTTDYEQLSNYDANSNPGTRRLRDGGTIGVTYDNLDRVTVVGPPNPEATMTFAYDNLDRLTSANGGVNLSFTYDALSRKLTEAGPQGTVTSQYDLADRRTQLTYPGTGLFVNTDYLVTSEATKVRENGASSGIGVLATYGYDNLGNRTSATFGNGTIESFGFDPVSRLSSLTLDLAGTTNDLTKTFAYNPANQIVTETRSNDAYSQALSNGSTASTTNGLNQLATVGGASAAYDARGNMTTDPVTGKTYSYLSANNQLYVVSSPWASHAYDALGRLVTISNGGIDTNYVADGDDTIAEYDGSNVLQKRYAFDGADGPLVQYDSAGNRTWLMPDERGSIVALASDSGAMTAINTYDEYGNPGAGNTGAFQYTGQLWLSRAGQYWYRTRTYGQNLGRFSQTDPIGYGGDGPNLYAYVLNDPVNGVDPLGLLDCLPTEICITGKALPDPSNRPGPGGSIGGAAPGGNGGESGCVEDCRDITIRGTKLPKHPKLPIVFAAYSPTSSNQCVQSRDNARLLNYGAKLYKGGTQTTQEHIIERHAPGGSAPSQYYSGDWRQIVNNNHFTFVYGAQSYDPTSGRHIFDAPHPLSILSFIGIRGSYGTRNGNPAFTNHLVVLSDCATVVTSYPR